MPKSTPHKLLAQAAYQKQPEQAKRQVQRVQAQRAAIKAGISKVGDGKDVAHKRALDNGGSNDLSNLSSSSTKKNRGWRRGGGGGYRVPDGD